MTKPDLMADLAADLRTMAGGELPDGDGVTMPVVLWAERWLAKIDTHHAELEAAVRDAVLLDFQERECITVRCEAADDDDVFYDAVSYHMAEPKERVIGTGTTPREALIQAMHNSAREG